MKSMRWRAVTLLAVVVCVTTLDAQGPPIPKPGPEFDALKVMVGTWDAAMKMEGAPQASKGTMTCALEVGGLWLVSTFQADFGGLPFQGRGLDSYDMTRKKYVGIWIDSMSTTPMIMEGTYDKGKKQMTMYGDHPDETGKVVKHKMVTTYVSDDHHAWTMVIVGQDGKETPLMSIKYTRKR